MTEPTTSSPAPAAPKPAPPPEGGVKDTIESILIAFILAFVFRAFVVEAFVIPTGSMAPTLLGAHMRFTCPDCGYHFTVNYNSRSEGADDLVIPSRNGPDVIRDSNGRLVTRDRVLTVTCPNCAYGMRSADTTNPPVHYGDRLLVLKYLYLFQDPHRWDVVVFKSPDPPFGVTPANYDYSVNYIKRLIGRPGESVVVLDGDVYVAPKDATNPTDFKIQTKPRFVQEALWRVVYDNDYYPRKLDRNDRPWKQPWTTMPNGSGWNLGDGALTGRTFHFDNASGGGSIFFDPRANTFNRPLTDWLAYDQEVAPNRSADEGINPRNVSDLKLSFVYTRHDGAGPLRASLTKQNSTFVAELTPTGVRLLKRTNMGPETELAKADLSLPPGKAAHVEFTNVDYRVSLRVDGHDVLVTTPDQYAPDVPQLLTDYNNGKVQPKPAIQIDALNQRSDLAHLSLWRDIYYINSRDDQMLHWAIPRDFPNNVVRLSDTPGKEEYFVMGDNSQISGDARYWTRDVNFPAEDLYCQGGRVPARFMLGKAFFVYWPAGFRPQDSLPGLIPNFGQMRFIH